VGSLWVLSDWGWGERLGMGAGVERLGMGVGVERLGLGGG
jgi:hypothetical protein